MADSEIKQQQPEQQQQQPTTTTNTPSAINTTAEKNISNTTNEGATAARDTSGTKETVVNGNHESPKKSPSKVPPAAPKKLATAQSPMKSPNKAASPKTPETPSTAEKKKVPMNKIQVGAAPSPNLKTVKSKIGSLDNAKHRPGGGNIKIESRKLNFNVQPKIEAKNDAYIPGGGDKKIQSVKLQWNAKPKVGSLDNAAHKPGGGDKKIESVKLDFKDKAKPKVGSKDNIKHVAGGGTVKIEDQKLEIKAQSKIGSLDNVKHRPGGGDKKIYDDKNYLKQMAGSTSDINATPNQGKKDSRRNSSSRSKSTEPKLSTREISIDGLNITDTKPTDQNFNQLNEKNSQQGTPRKEVKDITEQAAKQQTVQDDKGGVLPSSDNSDTSQTTPKENTTAVKQETKEENKKDANGNGKIESKPIETVNLTNGRTHENGKNDTLKTEKEIIKTGDENLQNLKENLTTKQGEEDKLANITEQSQQQSSKTNLDHNGGDYINNIITKGQQEDLTIKSNNLPMTNSDKTGAMQFVLVENKTDLENKSSSELPKFDSVK